MTPKLISTGSTLDVLAQADQVLVSVGIGGAGAGNYALGGSISVNEIKNTVQASISDNNGAAGVATTVSATGNVNLRASDNSTLVVVAGAGAGAGTAAVGAAIATAQVQNTSQSAY